MDGAAPIASRLAYSALTRLHPSTEALGGWLERFWRKAALGFLLAVVVAIPSVWLARGSDSRLVVRSGFLVAILAASWWGGLVGGLTATTVSSVVVYYWFTPPYHGWSLPTNGWAPFLTFLVAALAINAFNLWRRIEMQRLLSSRKEIGRRERELRRDAESLRAANIAKDAFLGSVSHELKSPLTTIIGGAQLLARPQDVLTPGDRMDLTFNILQAATRVNRVIDTLMVLARFDRGQAVEVGPLPLAGHLRRLVGETSIERRQKLLTEFPDETPLVVGNETCVDQVVRNLLSNAEKYSPEDSVITLRVADCGDEVIISVSDQGPGIPEADVEMIFEPFYRSETTAAAAAGDGIGLATARRLAEACGGRLWLESSKPGHTVFCLSLPKAPPLVEEPA